MEITTITPGKPGSNSLTGDCMDPSTETVIPSQSPTIRCDPVDTTSGRPEEFARTPFDSVPSHTRRGSTRQTVTYHVSLRIQYR